MFENVILNSILGFIGSGWDRQQADVSAFDFCIGPNAGRVNGVFWTIMHGEKKKKQNCCKIQPVLIPSTEVFLCPSASCTDAQGNH